MKNHIIEKDDEIDIKSLFKSDDMLISGGDIAFGGAAIGIEERSAIPVFAAQIASLAHIITRIVLSDRLVFLDDPEHGGLAPPTSYLQPLLQSHCNTLEIHLRHLSVESIVNETFINPDNVFGKSLLDGMNEHTRAYAPWSGNTLAKAWLAEYAVANTLKIPFAPNPFMSQPIGIHSLAGKASAEQLHKYVTDIRNETAKEMNLYEDMNIYDMEVPAIFGAVIRESNEPGDLIRVASQMNVAAKPFRLWCQNLDSKKEQNPKKYLDQLNAAKNTLKKLGSTLNTNEVERTQISTSGVSVHLPTPVLTKLVDYLNVDVKFFRPRHYLLNVLSSSLQLKRLCDELERVFGIDKQYAKEATEHLLKVAKM